MHLLLFLAQKMPGEDVRSVREAFASRLEEKVASIGKFFSDIDTSDYTAEELERLNEVASFNLEAGDITLTQTRILSEFTDALDTTGMTINTLSASSGNLVEMQHQASPSLRMPPRPLKSPSPSC